MTVRATLEAAGFKPQNGLPDRPLVAPKWAPIHGAPALPPGLAWAKRSGMVLRSQQADRVRVMVGWTSKTLRDDPRRAKVCAVTAWRWVITELDAARLADAVAAKQERLARSERRKAARRLADLEAEERLRVLRAGR